MSEAFLSFAKGYVRDARMIEADSLGDVIVPESWLALMAQDQEERVRNVLKSWKEFEPEFRETLQHLNSNLKTIDFVESFRGVQMIYGIAANDGHLVYYAGGVPGSLQLEPNAAALWEKLPQQFRKFYTNLHDGWHYFASESMGPNPMRHIFVMSDLEWGILDELPEVPVDLDQSLALFSNGMGGYLCQDLKGEPKTYLWYHNREPKLDLDFWPIMDTWIKIGLES